MSANSRKTHSAETYTVKQVSNLSGVSVRALRFYDEIGLLKPAFYGENGYRYYEKDQLLALQQILLASISMKANVEQRTGRKKTMKK